MATERLNVFKLATDKLVYVTKNRLRNDLYCVEWGVKLYSLTHYVTKIREEIVVVIANTSEQNRRIRLDIFIDHCAICNARLSPRFRC